ncbi:MAG TPA: hypothetical protein VND93_25195 [Myxococcales bacterium]|nr:hypothetical protein [Myxococcales bacterium]
MRSRSAPASRWRRALALVWRVVAFAFRILFIVLMLVIPIPIAFAQYRPHRERRNQVVQVLKKE